MSFRHVTFPLLLIGVLLLAGQPTQDVESSTQLRSVDNSTFARGEWLKFRVHYGFVTAGYMEMEVKPYLSRRNGRPCYHIVGKGYTHPSFEWFYKLNDVYESYCDEEALISWQFNRRIREGSYSSYSEIHFDQIAHQAKNIDNYKKESLYQVPVDVQDVISAFYYARAKYDHRKLRVGDRIEMHNFIDRRPYQLEAKVLAREVIKVEGKSYQAIKFDLLVEEVGMITDGSTIRFWISDDENKIPLRIETELLIGSLAADLIDTRGLLHPMTSLVP